ncbi:hypothetical protein SO802_031780 [Lithocarpus litseifolius]|uniref:RNase H type-1 domain-containing protein n=1 Tax=Lithocarpus litseifolius TaxID=425828 RepID=A0AAW2BLG2_9ROSI
MISDLFSTELAKAILAIPIPYNPRQDKLIWVPDSKAHDQWKISRKMTIIIDEIWSTRNLTQFQEGKVDIHKSKQIVLSRFFELSKTFSVMNSTPSVQPISAWTPPPLGWVKLNVDATLSNSRSVLAVVARNHLGEILFIWGSSYHLCAPSQAEAAATLWAVHLAIQEHWKSVIIEGDAQVCFNALSPPDFVPDCSISTIVSNSNSLLPCFVSCNFRWVRRNCNSAAHSAARLALNSPHPFCFNKSNLPHSLEIVCKGDCSPCS